LPIHSVGEGGSRKKSVSSDDDELLVEAGADVHAVDERLRENALGFALREYKDEREPAIQFPREKGAPEPP